jgi:superfamily II DNA/RNA helicase
MSPQSFADLGVSSAVCGALAKSGFEAPFAIQNLVIADVLAGRDVLAKSPTGSGKTLAFMVPIMDRIEATDKRPAALILAPTRELATQIVDASYKLAHARALRVTAVYGGVGLEKQAKAAAQSHIIVATPGRLEDLLNRRAFSLRDIKILVLDEADRMLDMGFRPAVDRVVAQVPRGRQTLFFSATLDGEAGRIAHEYTQDPVVHEHKPPEQKKADIAHVYVKVEQDRVKLLVDELSTKRDLALVFVRTKRGADRLVKRLGGEGVKAVAMHGNKSQRQRERALASFEAFEVDTLVATDVAARGIDVDDISHVINFDPPEDRETYVHRTGRTGRAGRTGTAITFVGNEQAGDVGRIASALGLEREWATAGLRPVTAGGNGGGGAKRSGGGSRGGASRGGGSRGHSGGSSHSSRGGSGGGHKGGAGKGKSPRGKRPAGGGEGSSRTVHSARPSGRGRTASGR